MHNLASGYRLSVLPRRERVPQTFLTTDTERVATAHRQDRLLVAFDARGILLIEATPISRWFRMLRASSSAAGVRFLASIKEGRGLKPSI